MARLFTYDEFQRRLTSRRLSRVELSDYLEIDPDHPGVRVRFRPGTLADAPPPDHDVDDELYRYQRDLSAAAARRAAKAGKPRVVAEGDSWFRLPYIITVPDAIATWVESNGRFAVSNIAYWGDTLAGMLDAEEYLGEIKSFRPDWFILSAGGNDIQHSLASGQFVLNYDAGRPLEDLITQTGATVLRDIGAGYGKLLNQVVNLAPDLKILCYAYDYPRPEVGQGQYIGKYLSRQGYPEGQRARMAAIILERLKPLIKDAISPYPNAVFLDCLHATDNYTWWNDMHPSNDGYRALAAKFEKQMQPAVSRAKRFARKRPVTKAAAKHRRAMRKPLH